MCYFFFPGSTSASNVATILFIGGLRSFPIRFSGSLLSAKDAPDLIETLSQTIDSLSSVEAAPIQPTILESHGVEVAFPLLLVKKNDDDDDDDA